MSRPRTFTKSDHTTWSILWLQGWGIARIARRTGASNAEIEKHLLSEGYSPNGPRPATRTRPDAPKGASGSR